MKPVRGTDNEYTRTVDKELCNRDGELDKLEKHNNVMCLLTKCRISQNRTTELLLNSVRERGLFE
jgi:hypothetical protein